MSFFYYPPSPPQMPSYGYPPYFEEHPYPPYYTGATPPGVRLGDVHTPQPPGWSLGDIFGRGDVEAWSTTFKVALVLGGIAAAYFLYKTVKEIGPPSKKVGEAAGAALVHMGGRRLGAGSSRASSRVIDAEFEPPSSRRSPPWLLNRHEGE